ncbi:MAG: EAL domain-containing protein [Eubacterium sp.]|nr:EAL domain-containing protein [Eubacterium sp.]
MLRDNSDFHSMSGRRQILIVDDEQVNRELLGFIANRDYDVLYASNGKDALDIMRREAKTLSLVLLDLNMPEMNGFQVLEIMKEDPELSDLPVLVLTAEDTAEVDCLRMGASDFIVKPFEQAEVVIARMERTIELYEDRKIILQTEREDMTGLFTRNYFYSYAVKYDQFHEDEKMDAIAMNIDNFHLINELYGRLAGNSVLQHLGAYLRDLRDSTGCIAARLQADQFLVYIPSGKVDYDVIASDVNQHFDTFPDIKVRIRCGVYTDVDKTIEIERRFDRAIQAQNTVRGDFNNSVAYYNDQIQKERLREAQLLAEFDTALEHEQFILYFQPKYNIEKEEPYLASAEALVRWRHPDLGMISPGEFIPLFEQNGLIQKLDFYIWKRTIEYMASWKEKYGKEIAVSVNISRMDLYSHGLIRYLEDELDKNGVSRSKLYLEILESAYMDNSDQMIEIVQLMRSEGFKVEMDDFGTGYSSLAMLAQVPVDVIKMDMSFVKDLRSNDRRETMIRLIMDIAKHLDISVVAEGVEDKDTVNFLKSVGCNTIQGFYFSRPLPEEEFVKKFNE